MQTHPEAAETIYTKQKEINEEWTQLTAKANARKEKLLDSYDLQRFLADYRYVAACMLLKHVFVLKLNSFLTCLMLVGLLLTTYTLGIV